MKVQDFGRIAILVVPLVLASQSAPAASANGSTALALAALVARESPLLLGREWRTIRRLFNGHTDVHFPPDRQIAVKADSIACRTSNVDITTRTCKLTFGSNVVELTGGRAHVLFATLALAGVPPDGAAGSVFEGLSKLVCTIDPGVIAQKAGGGADCTFEPGAP